MEAPERERCSHLAEPVVGLAVANRASLGAAPYGDSAVVEKLVRDALLAGGLGRTDPRAPLRDVIQPGMSVLLKPNWVKHNNHSGRGIDCLVTHRTFIRAALCEVLLAKPGKVILGDAPVQGCQWNELVTPQMRDEFTELAGGTPLEFADFRRTILDGELPASGVRNDVRGEDRFVLFDVGSDSLLEDVSRPEGRFRVTMYHPKRLAERHSPGRHQYLLCREAFEADVILSLPKLKTHGKAGITGSLKTLVGFNGNKDFLPHHRLGGTAWGGDCYPGSSPLRRAAEFCLDRANSQAGRAAGRLWRNASEALLLVQHRLTGDRQVEGMWYGNDTCWRMVLDLNRILLYGRPDGTLADTPRRKIWSLTDAILCGEGEGPLSPDPCLLGAVTFSGSAPAAEILHAFLLGLDPGAIPLLHNCMAPFRWPLAEPGDAVRVRMPDGNLLSCPEAARLFGVRARPPRGWVGHCELPAHGATA